MAQFYTSHCHHGWYDMQFCMPMVVRHPYPHPASPFPVLPCNARINAPQLHGAPPTDTPQAPEPDSTSNPAPRTPNPETANPTKRPLRSILKHPRSIPVGSQAPRRKSVRFTPSTASPPLAAPGTYKHAGRPKQPKARHPARSHPCLISTLQQRAQEAMAAVSGPPPPVSKHVSNTSTPSRVQPCTAADAAKPRLRPPTPPPTAFLRGPDHVDARSALQLLPRQSNTSATRQPAAAPAPKSQDPTLIRTGLKKPIRIQTRTHIPKAACSVSHARPYSSDSEDSSTDVRLATKLRLKKPQPTQMEVNPIAMTEREEAAATRRSLKALAREFDRKNAWRRGGE